MKAQQEAIGYGAVIGKYGDIFWDLPGSVQYLAEQDLYATIYVANTTDEDRSYMLRMRVLAPDGTVIGEGTLRVNNMAWFDLGTWEYARLPGSMRVSMTNIILVVELVDQDSNEATDAVSTYLVSPTAAQLPIWGGLPTVGGMDLMSLVLLVMMMGMMAMVAKEQKEKTP